MQNSTPLVIFGVAVIITAFLNAVIPYLRGKSDIVTAWNILWLGGAMFTGVGSIAVKYGVFHWPELKWFQPTTSDVQKYIVGSILFYGTMLVFYHALSWPRNLTARFFNKWPPPTFSVLTSCLAFFAVIAIGATAFQGVFFFGQLFYNMVHKALIFAVVFSFCYWYRDFWQFPRLLLFLGVFGFAALDAMVLFHGRRLLLSVSLAPIVCMYWLHWRNLSPTKNIVRVAAATFLIFCVAAMYSTFRHFSGHDKSGAGRSFSTTIQALKGASAESAVNVVAQDPYVYLSQYCAHYSLLTIQLIDGGQIEIQPLNTLTFLATYPIPRSIFPGKPQALGTRIVSEILRLPYPTNWGLGIVANGYHEGGLPVIFLYAVLIVLGVRLIDDALTRQPANPFLLAILATSAPHFATLIRGDPTTMAAEICETFLFAWVLGLIARFVFGTARPDGNEFKTPSVQRYPQFGQQFSEYRR